MFLIYMLSDWFRCYSRRFTPYSTFRGIGIFGVEPETPKPALPDAPPIHPCPDQRDGVGNPFF